MKTGIDLIGLPQETILKVNHQNQACHKNNSVSKGKEKKLNEMNKNRHTKIYSNPYQRHINRRDTILPVAR